MTKDLNENRCDVTICSGILDLDMAIIELNYL